VGAGFSGGCKGASASGAGREGVVARDYAAETPAGR
jgi:hypothetical protein